MMDTKTTLGGDKYFTSELHQAVPVRMTFFQRFWYCIFDRYDDRIC